MPNRRAIIQTAAASSALRLFGNAFQVITLAKEDMKPLGYSNLKWGGSGDTLGCRIDADQAVVFNLIAGRYDWEISVRRR